MFFARLGCPHDLFNRSRRPPSARASWRPWFANLASFPCVLGNCSFHFRTVGLSPGVSWASSGNLLCDFHNLLSRLYFLLILLGNQRTGGVYLQRGSDLSKTIMLSSDPASRNSGATWRHCDWLGHAAWVAVNLSPSSTAKSLSTLYSSSWSSNGKLGYPLAPLSFVSCARSQSFYRNRSHQAARSPPSFPGSEWVLRRPFAPNNAYWVTCRSTPDPLCWWVGWASSLWLPS